MSVNTKEFKLSLERFGKITRQQATVIVRKIALELDNAVVMATPVDTGRARGNWFPSIGAPSAQVDISSTDKAGSASAARVVALVATAPLGSTVWLSNNLDYIEKLENGSSKQAPHGMVATNMARIVAHYGGVVTR
jgi:hypothetical protein